MIRKLRARRIGKASACRADKELRLDQRCQLRVIGFVRPPSRPLPRPSRGSVDLNQYPVSPTMRKTATRY